MNILKYIWKALRPTPKEMCSVCSNPVHNIRSHPGHKTSGDLCSVCGDPIYFVEAGDGLEGATESSGWAHKTGNHYHYAKR